MARYARNGQAFLVWRHFVGDNAVMNAEASAPHRGIIILGTNYSGSHLLSHLLSAHSSCLGVGELHRYQQLVESGRSAPVVSEYDSSPIFTGLSDLPVEQWYGTLLQRFAETEAVTTPVIVDNSKKVRWVRLVSKSENLDLRLVHLIRDPRALVLRWLSTYDTEKRRRTQKLRVAKRVPTRAAQILAGDWVNVFTYKWLRENRQISQFLATSGLPHTTVTYHDMVFDTEPMLQRVMPELDLVFESGQLKFGEAGQFGTTKTAHAEAVRQSEIRPDVKWHTQLDPRAAAAVVANSDVKGYLAGLGLRCGEDGLVAAD